MKRSTWSTRVCRSRLGSSWFFLAITLLLGVVFVRRHDIRVEFMQLTHIQEKTPTAPDKHENPVIYLLPPVQAARVEPGKPTKNNNTDDDDNAQKVPSKENNPDKTVDKLDKTNGTARSVSTLEKVSQSNTEKTVEDIRKLILEDLKWSFEEALAAVANPDKVVILAMVDGSVTDIVTNLYESSIVPLGLYFTLFVSVSQNGCVELLKRHIPCVTYGYIGGEAAVYNSKAFLGKMNVRTNYTLRALELGYNVLQTDNDMVILDNPLPYFSCLDCHLEALQDGISKYINAGFVFIRASNVTVDVYHAMMARAKAKPTSEDQRNLNEIVRAKKVKYRVLDPKKFLCGLDYYEKAKRYYSDTAKPCPGCVVVHNNWIVSTPAKNYRFKEMGQWQVDDGGYYSSKTAKYITYDTKEGIKFFDDGKSSLINALAIAQVLNRTVVLPKFRGSDGKNYCPLNCHIYIKDFDRYFKYREHMFLNHSKVPSEIKQIKDISKISIGNDTASEKNVKVYSPKDAKRGATEPEIKEWFGNSTAPMLYFVNLKHAFGGFSDNKTQAEFDGRVKAGIKKAVYRQY